MWSAGFTNPHQQWCTLSWGFHTVWGGIDPWDNRLGSRFVGICRDMEEFLIRGWDLNLPVSGPTSTLAGGATLAARWHAPQPISNHPVGLGFPHLAGRCRPEGSAFSSPDCWRCRDMEGFLNQGWERILPGCDGTSALARGATRAARWLHEPQPINNHPVGLGFPHLAGRYRPGRSLFSSPNCWS